MTEVEVSITVNGTSRTQRVDTTMSLLDLLRERLGLLVEPGPSVITGDLTADAVYNATGRGIRDLPITPPTPRVTGLPVRRQ